MSMSDSSGHDESEFYYPDELSDNELLEQTQSIESKLLSDESIKEFIQGQKQENTVKKTKYDMNVFSKFLRDVGETRQVTDIPCIELDKLLCNFYINVRRKDNTEYEPDTLSSFSRSIQRHLDDNKSKINILKDDEFKTSREVLKSKRRELRKKGKGNHPHATEALTDDDINRIFAENQFGVHNPKVLSRTMWFLITLHFGHRARHEARQLKFGDIALKVDNDSQEEYLEWLTERHSKTRHGDEHEQNRAFRPKAYATGDEKCPVFCFRHFIYRRPDSAKKAESPFFLAINHRRRPEDEIWFLDVPMGKNKIGKFLSEASEKAQLSKSGKITNHSVRKTCIKTLLDSGVSHNTVAQLSGHKNPKSLDNYAVASHAQQRSLSKILSGKTPSTSTAMSTTPASNATSSLFTPVNPNTRQTQQSQQTQALFSGANIGVLNIQTLVLPRSGGNKPENSPGPIVKRRRRHFIESSDEEDL